MKRRTFTNSILLATGALMIPRRPLFSSRPALPDVPAELRAAEGVLQIGNGSRTPGFLLNGSMPSPTLRIRRGERFRTTLVNDLPEQTVLHWHGLLAPAEMDGQPRHAIGSGASRLYDFTVNQPAGTFWYHPHTHGRTAAQVYFGLAGFFLVHDDEEEGLGLPSGAFELPLMLQDRRLDESGAPIYAPEPSDIMNGWQGNAGLVNGRLEPTSGVQPTLYRLRFLNASNARVFRLALGQDLTMHLIGNDAGLLDRPVEVDSLTLGPAARADVLVDFTGLAGQSVELRSLQFLGDGSAGSRQGRPLLFGRFDVEESGSSGSTIPTSLRTIERLDPSGAMRTRSFRLGMYDGRHAINDYLYRMGESRFTVSHGSTEIWEFRNPTFYYHPMHVHGVHFQVLDRNGDTDLPHEDYGWKDTVLVSPYETVRILVRFDAHPGRYMLHCHNLEHEDDGMMMNFDIDDTGNVGDRADSIDPIRVWPNPARDRVEVTVRRSRGDELRLFDLQGSVVDVATVGVDGRGVLDVSRFARGRYWLEYDGASIPVDLR